MLQRLFLGDALLSCIIAGVGCRLVIAVSPIPPPVASTSLFSIRALRRHHLGNGLTPVDEEQHRHAHRQAVGHLLQD